MACPQLERGHLDIANELVDKLAQTQLSGYESRILWAIWRKTYCWHKKEDWISYSQFKELTKIGNDSHISRTLKRLIARNIITKNGNSYQFNKDYEEWTDLPKMVIPLTKIGKNDLPKLADTKENLTKETITKESSPKKIAIDFFNAVMHETQQYQYLTTEISEKKKIPKEVVELEIKKFTYYWTEPNSTGNKQRWELQKTFEVARRLATWLDNANKFTKGYKNVSRVAEV